MMKKDWIMNKRLGAFAGTVWRFVGDFFEIVGKHECPKCGKRALVKGPAGANCWACGLIQFPNAESEAPK